ncbi:hypothetical protein SLEP1_g28745 [Rubroshorea leprosula]|uniref:Uncharacterized protein n=1 Tax=Rubroshorea leprosula TaxID=152421 RepID=A0AAV5K130_9ROSI|nr:hypothetical protein SLEP1_g28745 [Rubroshorea leprosula]
MRREKGEGRRKEERKQKMKFETQIWFAEVREKER